MSRSTHPENEQKFGEPIKYDPDFNGPMKGRSCTDIICFLLFVTFVVCWIGIGIFAFWNGNANTILIPRNTNGEKCGYDVNVFDKPYLYFIDITKCAKINPIKPECDTQQICVEKCPNEKFFWKENDSSNDKSKLICIDDAIKKKQDSEITQAIKDGLCSKWYVPSVSVFKRCIFVDYPLRYAGLNPEKAEKLKNKLNIALSWLSLSIQNTVAKFTDDKGTRQAIVMITEDIMNTWWEILIGLGCAIVFCFMYIYLMKYVASYVVWFSLIGVVAILSFGVYATTTKYLTLKDKPDEQPDNLLGQKNVWLAFVIILSFLLGLTLLILIFLRKRILIAVALIKEGSKAVGACISSLFFPIIPWILQILILAYAIGAGLYLATIGKANYRFIVPDLDCLKKIPHGCPYEQNNTECDPRDFRIGGSCSGLSSDCGNCSLVNMQNPAHIKIFHVINVVGGFWATFFASAFGEMVLAGTFATWYWTFKKTNVPFFTVTGSIYRTLRYHVGTLAFGSLIITICRLIRIAIEYIDHKLKKYDNPLTRAMICCCKCFFWCLENFLKFINRNAYIMCAIHGKNFCVSAKDAFSLLMRNILRVFVLDKVTDLLFFLGKVLITTCVAVVAYTAFTSDKVFTKTLYYPLVPVIIIAIGTFFITNVFFGVYSMAVDTLFLCFLEDCERNDGSAEKPYYMSKQLMKILGKKNKKDKNK